MNNKLYEEMHTGKKMQKKIINSRNFTYRHILQYLDKYSKQNQYVLDVGSGVGTLCFYLASSGCKIDGVEVSKSGFQLAKSNLSLFNFKFKPNFYNVAFEDFKPTRKYDIVLATEVLEHVKDDSFFLNKVSKLLKNRAIFICSTPTKTAPLYRLGLLKKFDQNVGHLRRYNSSELITKIKSCGFEILEVKENEGVLRNLLFTNRFFSNITRLLKGFLSDFYTVIDNFSILLFGPSNVIIVARKK